MPISRDVALAVNRAWDEIVPPVLRDSRWFMRPAMRLLLGRRDRLFLDFKERAFAMSPEEFADVYAQLAEYDSLQGESDLNDRCTEAILETVTGDTVLDVGCGRGYLAGKLAERRGWVKLTACDIVLDEGLVAAYPQVTFMEGNVESLPFDDDVFDTVVCTHTLEHVQHLSAAIGELRRVARRRLLIVVPKQRPYKYTFNLHVHFFPYPWTLQAAFGAPAGSRITDLGDWFYVEEIA
ncbi:MAG: class I SAM-dependent methyltransferase [Longispora sp.]|nr:class I SAM-dependent methyltransferase [Longispora sp. (in: high G+C Gram-positive bacteria)]